MPNRIPSKCHKQKAPPDSSGDYRKRNRLSGTCFTGLVNLGQVNHISADLHNHQPVRKHIANTCATV